MCVFHFRKNHSSGRVEPPLNNSVKTWYVFLVTHHKIRFLFVYQSSLAHTICVLCVFFPMPIYLIRLFFCSLSFSIAVAFSVWYAVFCLFPFSFPFLRVILFVRVSQIQGIHTLQPHSPVR